MRSSLALVVGLPLACTAVPPPPLEASLAAQATAAPVRAPAPATPAPPPMAPTLEPVAPRSGAAATAGCSFVPSEIGRVDDARLDELSGIVASRRNPGVFFVHNDSGDSARFFALDRGGHLLAEIMFPARVLDLEEIALGPAPEGEHFVYLGDTGNNFARSGRGIPRSAAFLYRVPEPTISGATRQLAVPAESTLRIELTFPERARDVEAFFVDPRSGDAFLITKEDDGRSLVLRAAAAELASGKAKLTGVGALAFGAGALSGNRQPSAADISEDGSKILIRTYSAVFLFERRAGERVEQALQRPPRQLPTPSEPQGEAIAFAPGATSFVTVSEGHLPPLYCVAF